MGVTLNCLAWSLERALYVHRVALTPDGLVVPVAWSSDKTLVPYGEIMGAHVEGANRRPVDRLVLTRERTFRVERSSWRGDVFEEDAAILTDRVERQDRDIFPGPREPRP